MIRKAGLLVVGITGATLAYKKAAPVIDPGCGRTEESFRCVTYVENYDGDTLTVNIPRLPALFGYKVPVRIAHIDTAEMDSADPCEKASAIAAKDKVLSLLKGAKKIDLINVKRDKYFRILSEVTVNGEFSLGAYLIANRLAVPYEGETKPLTNWCLYAPNSLKK
jgi:micrococcal nuclease